ncbi:DUF4157 domain-containing protein [Hyalangium minutum]|uniref:eCIS core domain-containing protein n=1 Tax=Hyalangium minutum TaxID=394096 RepID=A0A085WSS7_9BACT|nr:DUF4157 domain-containing protein [Hyalangium minutum]KFE70740.1 hypothetical protein DB31_5782 [Hyalangium minutum]
MPHPHKPMQTSRPGNVTALAEDLLLPTGGRPLPPSVRRSMEQFFDADFSDVRILVGPHVSALGARAFTLGSDIHFAPGEYSARTGRGLELLGHELTHVLQQRTGRARGRWGRSGVVLQDAALEAEADSMGRRAAARLVRGGHLLDSRLEEAPLSVAAMHDTLWQPVPAGALVQLQPEGEALSEATFLKVASKFVYDRANKEEDIMEVQATILNGALYFAANYRAGQGLYPLSKYYPPNFDFWHNKKREKIYRKADIQTIQGTLHAEQALLGVLAQKLKNGEALTRMVVIGTKRPCSYCRRVLRAFNTALAAHYPDVNLHFVDRTGKTVPAEVERLTLVPGSIEGTFKRFATQYAQELAALIPFHAGMAHLADEAEETNSVRTNASPEISYMT